MRIKLTSEAKKPNISLTVPSIIVVALDVNVLLTIETHLLSVSKPGDHYYISSIQKRNWRGLPTKEIKMRSPVLGLNQTFNSITDIKSKGHFFIDKKTYHYF